MQTYFWNDLSVPIIAPSPMDGVTDAAYRFITDKYGKPSILFTEFTSVEGIAHGAAKILNAFIFHKTNTPTVAQLYGTNPADFYNSVILVCEMGFDGVDINMGCPDVSISRRGAGAGLIRTPALAKEIIKTAKKAVKDYANGKKLDETSLPKKIINWVKEYNTLGRHAILDSTSKKRRYLPVSVKTRIGYDDIVTHDWVSSLLEMEPAAISIHGRTLKQMYTGLADWEEIGIAARLVKMTKTKILGNGDVRSIKEAMEKIEKYNLDGVLIGRASYGNPWIFKNYSPANSEKIKVALEHCEEFMRLTPEGHFVSLRKHLAWYTKGIPGSNELRNRLMTVDNVDDVRRILV